MAMASRRARSPMSPCEIALNLKFRPGDNDHIGRAIDCKPNRDRKINCPGRDYTESEVQDIEIEYMDWYCERMGVYAAARDKIIAREDYDTPFPPFPLKVFPPATTACFVDECCCYHTVFTTPRILLPLHQLLDIVRHNVCCSSSLCVCQALSPHIPLVCMEYLPFGITWTGDGIMSSTVLDMLLSRWGTRQCMKITW
ncbi:uncharacterized protein LOC104583574 isoform X1 [Brachypodium distachyon]|uniref:uncharacterized protein LOC104583574 isoform X1 n=1 Tax=Brachypodium distachyon TaxID=15368 RepID=UPI0005300A6D|nr:uncharacterized protein LOC104583574 isoform X1 [Brachypodium distachyon]XP_024316906.1 uncharacterized protein LOC104583574 isoform X1 [Brachypodium distachyon]XP_024316907.1 uncharacterized protein LOC104583574 isoform X1 [Brachypodium distachyon]|eukprot:XP_014756415.1 uncharacterized protein LOC104583574 isoform X1 [Brachypodium distachyon]